MRIIAGWLGGRGFDSPRGHRTHPMSEKARGAIFNALGDIKGLTVIDAFAGSGALAFEAVSRGASSALAVELDKSAYAVIKQNIENLGIGERVKCVRANVSAWSNRNQDVVFDVVLCDPPYDDIQYKIIRKLTNHLKSGGIFVISLPGKHEILSLEGLEVVQTKDYGDAQLVFYRRIS